MDLVVPRQKLRETIVGLLRYLRAAPLADKSGGNGNGTQPIAMPRSYIDAITGRDSRKPREVVRG